MAQIQFNKTLLLVKQNCSSERPQSDELKKCFCCWKNLIEIQNKSCQIFQTFPWPISPTLSHSSHCVCHRYSERERERERALDLQRVTHTGKEKKKGVVSFLCFFDCNLGHFLQKIFWNSLISRQNLFTRNNGESSALFRYRQLEVLRTRDHCILGKTFNTLSPHF